MRFYRIGPAAMVRYSDGEVKHLAIESFLVEGVSEAEARLAALREAKRLVASNPSAIGASVEYAWWNENGSGSIMWAEWGDFA